jgi:hypothetical protein
MSIQVLDRVASQGLRAFLVAAFPDEYGKIPMKISSARGRMRRRRKKKKKKKKKRRRRRRRGGGGG